MSRSSCAFAAVDVLFSAFYSGLWYPVAVAAMSFVVGVIFLPEIYRDITRM